MFFASRLSRNLLTYVNNGKEKPMPPKTEIFTEKETIVGYVESDSGSLLIADGIWEINLREISRRNKIVIDIERDKVRIPIIATRQNNRRFLLIPIDSAELINHAVTDKVDVDDQVILPEVEDVEQ